MNKRHPTRWSRNAARLIRSAQADAHTARRERDIAMSRLDRIMGVDAANVTPGRGPKSDYMVRVRVERAAVLFHPEGCYSEVGRWVAERLREEVRREEPRT